MPDKELLSLKVVKQFLDAYLLKHDINKIEALLTDDFLWTGLHSAEEACGKPQTIVMMLDSGIDVYMDKEFPYEIRNINTIPAGEGCIYFQGVLKIYVEMDGEQWGVGYRELRFTALIREINGNGKLAAIHMDAVREAEEVEEHLKESAKFHFLLKRMCKNSMEVNVATHESVLTLPEENQIVIGNFDEQITEFANSVVVAEERDAYKKEFSLDNIVSKVKKNSGLYINYCNVEYEDGRHYLLICNTMFTFANGSEYVFLYAQDLTNIRRKEEENRKVIENALEEAEHANMAKTDFLSNMSHEIRTPLNGIIGMQALMREAASREELESYLQKAETSAKQLLYLVNDILDMSKIESGKLQLECKPVEKNVVMNYLQSIILPQAEVKKVKIEFHCDSIHDKILLMGDESRLIQILLNPLSNALKFTESGGRIIFDEQTLPINETSVMTTFTITDNGIGMSEEFLQKIFMPFEQEKTAQRTNGTGLGLAITKQLVEAMHGTVSAESKVGAGSKITIRIPFEMIPRPEGTGSFSEKKGHKRSSDFHGFRALVVEDNEINREIEEAMLCNMGFEVETAVDGIDGVERFGASGEFYYDVIFIDIMMPRLDGYGASRQIRSMERRDSASVPIIALTANAFVEDIKKTKENGMDYHVSKPFSKEDIIDAMEKCHKSKRS